MKLELSDPLLSLSAGEKTHNLCILSFTITCRYSHHSLKESFSGLDMTLKFPYRDLTLARANYDFTPDQKESNMLSFRSGEVLAVIDRMGDSVGWWKAIKENRIGYIPRDFVSPL